VLILPVDRERSARPARPLSVRERWLVRGAAAVAFALVVTVAISLAAGGRSSRHGCIHATFPGPVGAEQVDSCGTAARGLCASVLANASYGPEARRTVAAECRKAGLPVGP
jgi:hypothetical protein